MSSWESPAVRWYLKQSVMRSAWKKVWKEIRKGDCREAANDWSWSPALKRSKKRMPLKEKLRGSKSEKCAV